MPPHLTDVRLWKETLGRAPALEQALARFRERAAHLVGEIHRWLPDYTVHDVSHLDALWQYADRLAGDHVPLTPIEGFVLGGAILLHDAAMSVAAYPGGVPEIEGTEKYADLVAEFLSRKLGRAPRASDRLTDAEKYIVLGAYLRENHAAQAHQLATASWKFGGDTYRLIEDDDLRANYGELIGRLAHSHWWPVDRLAREFRQIQGASGRFPPMWTVDPLKIAVLLRCADASHLDVRRSPPFLAALRQVSGFSAEHWKFQSKLAQPQIETDRLVMTSSSRFGLSERKAWWLCLDAARMVDDELRRCDALLTDMDRPRLAARSVAAVEDPARFAEFVTTDGSWEPVEARLRVTQVSALVERLGGRALYGDDPTIPLRELIQNAIDAVNARRLLERRDDYHGRVTIRRDQDEHGIKYEISDNGVGMSRGVLTGALLDFGTSFWASSQMRSEHPGLLSAGFQPIGKFGIGFFSVFMWGSRVTVVTRRPEDGVESTLVLEFEDGSRSNPTLRKASRSEQLREPGTRVQVWLSAKPTFPQRPSHSAVFNDSQWSLERLVAWLCPAAGVDLYVSSGGESRAAVTADDWQTLPADALMRRIHESEESAAIPGEWISTFTEAFALVREDGEPVGRGSLLPERTGPASRWRGIVTVGGIRAAELENFGGVLVGTPSTADRFGAVPIASRQALAHWAGHQRDVWRKIESSLDRQAKYNLSRIIATIGGEMSGLPIGDVSGRWVDQDDLVALAKTVNPGQMVHVATLAEWTRAPSMEPITSSAVLSIVTGASQYQQLGYSGWRRNWPPTDIDGDDRYWKAPLEMLVLRCLARAWNCSPERLLENSRSDNADLASRKPAWLGYFVTRPGD